MGHVEGRHESNLHLVGGNNLYTDLFVKRWNTTVPAIKYESPQGHSGT